MKLPVFLLLASLAGLSADEPIRQAAEARVWLKVPKDQPPLKGITVSTGQVGDPSWEKDTAARERFSDISFPIRWWKWSEIVIRFTPEKTGTAELTLSGPWTAISGNSIYRQEILWDQLSATGTTLANGGFEETNAGQPVGWVSPLAPCPAADAWPLKGAAALEGSHLAATWHNRPLVQTLALTAGQTVTLTLHAKSATPPDFVPPKRLGSDTPAHAACARLKRGVNLGNSWESPPGQRWGPGFSPEDIDHIADEGFDHVRIPVAWHHYIIRSDQGNSLSPQLLGELEPVLRRAMDRKLHVLLEWHAFDAFTKNPAANLDLFVTGWETIARHFKSWPESLYLELLNEPWDGITTESVGPIYQKTVSAIRKIDPTRILVVSPAQWGQVGELDRLRLPDDDRLIVTLHCYEPFMFTHQGAGWVNLQDLKGIVYPGPPAKPYQLPASLENKDGLAAFIKGYNTQPAASNPSSANAIRGALREAAEWSAWFGRPVHLGEFGAYNTADDASRARYLRDVRLAAEELKIPWTLWEWKSSFGYWDPEAKKPRFRNALFDR